MSVRSTVIRALLVVVASSFGAAAKVGGAAAGRTDGSEAETSGSVTPPAPLGPRASAGRQAVVTGIGPGPERDGDD